MNVATRLATKGRPVVTIRPARSVREARDLSRLIVAIAAAVVLVGLTAAPAPAWHAVPPRPD